MTYTSAWKVCMCLHSKCCGVLCLYAALLHVNVGLWITCKWWMLNCWQGENWPGGFDPAPCQSSSPSARSRRTLSWVSRLVTWCSLTWLDSLSCPTTAASKETCPPVLISLSCHLWTLQAWVHHGNNAKGKSDTCYFVLINDPLLVSCSLLNFQPL